MDSRTKSSSATRGRVPLQSLGIPDALRHFSDLPDCARVRLPVVMGLYGCSAASVWRMAANGRIPKPEKISDGITAWKVGDLRTALKGR